MFPFWLVLYFTEYCFSRKPTREQMLLGRNNKRVTPRCVGCRKDSHVSGTPGAVGSTGFVCSCCGRRDPQISRTMNSPAERKHTTKIAVKAQLRYLPFSGASGQYFAVTHHQARKRQRRSTGSPLFNTKTLDDEWLRGSL